MSTTTFCDPMGLNPCLTTEGQLQQQYNMAKAPGAYELLNEPDPLAVSTNSMEYDIMMMYMPNATHTINDMGPATPPMQTLPPQGITGMADFSPLPQQPTEDITELAAALLDAPPGPMDLSIADADLLLDPIISGEATVTTTTINPSILNGAPLVQEVKVQPTPQPKRGRPPSANKQTKAAAGAQTGKSGKRPLKRQWLRQKEELEYLRKRVKVLHESLDGLKRKQTSVVELSPWEKEARAQMNERKKAERENKKMKVALEKQLKFAESLKMAFSLMPSESIFPTTSADQWRMFRLPKNRSQRVRDMNLIADQEYQKLQGVSLEEELKAMTDEFEKISVNELPEKVADNTCLEYELNQHTQYKGINYEDICDDYWKLLSEADGSHPAVRCFEKVDDNLLYMQFIGCGGLKRYGGRKTVANVVIKRFITPNRITVIFRCILDDELYEMSSSEVRACDNGHYIFRDISSDPARKLASVNLKFYVRPQVGNEDVDEPAGMTSERIMEVLMTKGETMDTMIKSLPATKPCLPAPVSSPVDSPLPVSPATTEADDCYSNDERDVIIKTML